jgi:hypothetical protein
MSKKQILKLLKQKYAKQSEWRNRRTKVSMTTKN